MTKNEIIEMAREAVRQNTILDLEDVVENDFLMLYFDEIEAFAKLVAAKEREACAKVCDSFCQSWLEGAEECADAIRARGEQA
jgi:phosphoserine phosphatase